MNLDFQPLTIGYFLNSLQTSGKIVYEYNPFRNFRLTEDTDINGLHRGEDGFDLENYTAGGTIVDLDTNLLNFNLNYPVTMDVQPSYDGSVNIILNDNNNIPRLINSRFSTLQNNTYEIVDRIGNNDTNIYDDSQFDIDSSLYKRVNTIPSITFNGILQHGNLKVGNYVIYVKYADADDNETDFVGETGIISCFIGGDCDPFSINGGFRDISSHKSISLTVTDVDDGYDYIKIYYTRTTSDIHENRITKAYKIQNKYPVRNKVCTIIITGDENQEEITLSDINTKYFVADKAKAQVQCQNRLFLGNVNKFEPDHKDLQDISLRMYPYYNSISQNDLIGKLNGDYQEEGNSQTGYEYYNSSNIYNHVGYWDEEIYRLGVVYILNNGTLSPVYNIRGIGELPTLDNIGNTYRLVDVYNNGEREYIEIEESSNLIKEGKALDNSKGVVRINADTIGSELEVIGIGIYIPEDVITYLGDKVQGMFFVRQKRIPTILAQTYTLPIDQGCDLPIIEYNSSDRVIERFLDSSGNITNTYSTRLDRSCKIKTSAFAGICPEYEVNQPYFNQFFTGTKFLVRKAKKNLTNLEVATYNERHYQSTNFSNQNDTSYKSVNIVALSDNMQIAAIDDIVFRARAGTAEEAWKVQYIGEEKHDSSSRNLVRGIYSAYLGIKGDLDSGCLYNIYIPGFVNNTSSLFNIRYEDDSAYYAIGDRIAINQIKSAYNQKIIQTTVDSKLESKSGYYNIFYRGDCYICNFTHRLNRNFQDPEAPTNDEIVDSSTWINNYNINNLENNYNINRGDINAVELGSWITIKVKSTHNLSIRSLDPSYPDEEGLTGIQRGFYPLQPMSYKGNAKIPSSEVINYGYSSTVGERYNFTLPDVPYIKNRYDTRIMYSDITIGDAFKNGYRVFNLTNYRDYPKTYGGITTLVEFRGNIVCVFEHGIAIIPVNERSIAGEGAGGNVYINTSNVLPENPKIISDTFGSQWAESVIKTPYGIYGVDTVGKKIWRTNGYDTFECISDFSVQKFLNDNITLTERELTPIIGVRNVKTHYNKYKGDVMFTFYDGLYGFEEKTWNLCYNELLQKWITFYSWVPSYSSNIYNQYFSFDRNTSKWIAKLGTSNAGSNIADGVTLSKVIINNDAKPGDVVGDLSLSNRVFPSGEGIHYTIKYELCRDHYQNYKKFKINDKNQLILKVPAVDLCSERYQRNIFSPKCFSNLTQYKNINNLDSLEQLKNWKEAIVNGDILEVQKNHNGTKINLDNVYNDNIVTFLNIRATIDVSYDDTIPPSLQETYENYINGIKNSLSIESAQYETVLAVIPEYNLQFLTTDFWKHGQAGIIDTADKIYPTYWYGKQHPFEFEFVVADNPDKHKIFDNLEIISNNAEPDSFHYEIVGDCYDFAKDKKNMYIRQEATKELYQYNGCDVTYDHEYSDLDSEHRPLLDSDGNEIPGFYDRSTLMPLYYSRQDTINEIEDSYHLKDDISTKDFSALAGGEIVHYKTLDEYRIWNHAKVVDMESKGRLRGNMQYNEDKWLVQINPINLVYKNEKSWDQGDIIGNRTVSSEKVPIELGQSPIPDEILEKGDITYDPNNPANNDIPENSMDRTITSWDWKETQMQEVKLKDKWIKIRIRYTGNKLAIITAIRTLYSVSYS